MRKKIELIAPGGSLEKIEYAYHFGADAVYAGLPNFSLRSRINEFNERRLVKAAKLARILGKKIYFTINVYAHERHLEVLKKHLKFIKKIKPDAVIVSDPGIINLVRNFSPKIKIHLSTQANTTNSEAVKFWQKLGVSRIILAREVTLEEIRGIRKACPKIELEYFVHGAMCMSYSGRCLLSRWMRNRSANLGDCAQPCRWPYHVTRNTKHVTQENKEEIILSEDEHGTYFLNSKDLCLIEYLDNLAKAGVNSFKIEGRTKSAYYVACLAKSYKKVLDAIKFGKSQMEIKKVSALERKELEKLVNRGYSTGFLFGKDKWENDFEKSHQESKWQFVGEIIGIEPTHIAAQSGFCSRSVAGGENWAKVKIHNVLKKKERVEIIMPDKIYGDEILEIRNSNGEKVKSAHGGGKQAYFVRLSRFYPEKSMLRKYQG
ncbi:MAG: hypothetical protein A2184_02285 [Candidatus Moranbacteria bacterium RIFOXYA1_FULL_44_7]|nr:MAG: hypothetical protein A2184_02285 [Candidatus Moranbacteria bacterium RIFOXYA1_FULL_44_7]